VHRVSDYVQVKVTEVGFADEGGQEGLIWFKSGDGKQFAMRAFSGEVAMHMQRFIRGDRSSIPSVYNIIEELAERDGVHLGGVEVYPSGDVLRSDMQFLGKGKDALLRGYRASDAIAMALFYDVPIMLHHSLLESEQEEDFHV
jgi:bifunctional DNase/RNase